MKSYFNHGVLTVGAPLVTALWFLAIVNGCDTINAASIEPLFTGLALVAVIAAFVQEREQSADREREHHQLLKSMGAQVKAMCHASRIAAITAAIENDELECSRINVVGVSITSGSGKQAFDRKNALQQRIHSNRKRLSDAADITEFF